MNDQWAVAAGSWQGRIKLMLLPTEHCTCTLRLSIAC